MIDYLNDIKPLQDQGLSSSDIASHLSFKTASPMGAEQVNYILQDTGAVLNDPVNPNQRTGSLISYYQSLPEGDSKDLIAFFIGRIYNGQEVKTDQWPRSLQFKAIEDVLPQDLASVSAKLIESAGGRVAQSVTEADVTAAQQTWEQQQVSVEQTQAQEYKYATLYNQNIAPLIDSVNADDAAWQAALNSMAAEWGN